MNHWQQRLRKPCKDDYREAQASVEKLHGFANCKRMPVGGEHS